MKKIIFMFLLICPLISGCVFSGYGIKYETGNYAAIKINGDELNAVISLKESDPETLKGAIKELMKEWNE